MAIQVINVGTKANGGGGDALRDAMIKINENFEELYDRTGGDVASTIIGADSTILVDGPNSSLNADALTGTAPAGVVTFPNISNTPTTVAGYGITDAYTKAQTNQLIAIETSEIKNDLASGSAGAIDASVLTGSLPAIDGSALTGITAGVASSLDGDMTGSVFADDSTLLVDGVNGVIPGSVIDGPISVPSIFGVGGGSTNYLDLYADYVGQVSKDGQKRIFATDTVNDVFEIGSTAPYSEYQPTLKVYGNAQFGSITLTGGSALTGDITGSVYADDSTLLVDGVNGTLNSSALSMPISIPDGTISSNYIGFGNDDDLKIFHNGSSSIITETNLTSSLILRSYQDVRLADAGGTETMLKAISHGAVELYHNNVKKFETSADGVAVTGKITGLTDPTDAQDAATKAYVDANIGSGGGGSSFTNIGIGADDSTIRSISEGESFLILGGTGITTASDAEGNITITGFDGAFTSLSGTPTTLAGYGITDALTAGGALEGSSLQPTDETTASTQGTTLELSGGDSTGLNSDGGDLTLVGGNGSSGTHGDISIGATQTGTITIGSGSNNVDFPSGTNVDFTGTTVTGLSVSGLQSRSTATGTTSSLADAAEADLDITGFKSYALLAITTDRAARVRLYVTSATRTADASRAEGVDPTSDAGLIAEVITTGAETVIISPGAFGFNLESTPTTTIPCRVTNKSGGTSTVQVDLNILQLEA